jgi:hypothetical protein
MPWHTSYAIQQVASTSGEDNFEVVDNSIGRPGRLHAPIVGSTSASLERTPATHEHEDA